MFYSLHFNNKKNSISKYALAFIAALPIRQLKHVIPPIVVKAFLIK